MNKRGFWPLAIVFALYVLFLYGPVITIFVLSFQGPEGGLTLPMRGVSLHWFRQLAEGLGTVDIAAAFRRSLLLGSVVMACTVLLSLLAGLAFRMRLAGGDALFYVAIASLIMPSIIVSLGIGLEFRLIDGGITAALAALGAQDTLDNYGSALGLLTSALGAHLTWTLPFGLLIMFAVFNRFDRSYFEAARDLGATPWQAFRKVIAPLAAPGIVTAGILVFIFAWNDLLLALSLTATQRAITAPVAIANFTGSSQFEEPTGSIAAGAMVITVPIIIFVLIFQRRIVAGLTSGAVKG
jgi:putative spermidine/putrescine transport system permease protein